MPFMARILGILMAIVLLGALSAGCSPTESARAPASGGLDALFERLHRTTNDSEARLIEATIRHAWTATDHPEAARMMGHAMIRVHQGDLDGAIALLDQVVALSPGMVAAWNLRATVRYAQDDHAAALADIAMTLKLEPRHFGAWAGLGLIMMDHGRDRAALRAFEQALRLNPHMTDLAEDVRRLRDQVSGTPL